jgi:hypothetical protein
VFDLDAEFNIFLVEDENRFVLRAEQLFFGIDVEQEELVLLKGDIKCIVAYRND